MSLTAGTSPFGKQPAGRLNFEPDPPTGSVLFWDPVPYRLRGVFAGETVFDTTGARLLHETGHLPVYYVPEDSLRDDLLEPTDHTTHCPHKGDARYRSIRVGDRVADNAVWSYPDPLEHAGFLAGYAAVYWDRLHTWLAEDAELLGHARDPYHRIDVFPTSRRVRVSLEGVELADSTRALALYESGLPPRFYLPREDVRMELLEPSERHTRCAYKGLASYWHVRLGDEVQDDLAWTYPDPEHDAPEIEGRIAFFDERVDVELDGVARERPATQWSR
jgi:uncharacterized protein (DUF427 family)